LGLFEWKVEDSRNEKSSSLKSDQLGDRFPKNYWFFKNLTN
jgi:hypothetical protein